MKISCVFLCCLALAVVMAGAAQAAIQGSSTASNCGEGGNWIDITFTGDGGVTLVDAWWDFNGTNVWLDADGASNCSPINDGVSSYSFYFDGPVGTDTQDFGLTATGFGSGDYFRFTMDLDLGATGMPYGADFMGATVTVEFSDGTIVTGIFDTPYDSTNGATAHFFDDMPNLEFTTRPGWAGAVVPRNAADATWNSVPAPTLLVGDAPGTWLNGVCQNTGDYLADTSRMEYHLDGAFLTYNNLWVIPAGDWNGAVNMGPYTVPGGRHVLRITADTMGHVDESDETDNVHSVQYCWRGADLAPLGIVTRATPPLHDLDWEYGAGGSWWNCDGMRVTPDPIYDWVAVWCEREADSGHNYMLRLHPASDDPENAFGTNFGASRGGEDLQAMLVNTHTMGAGPWDVGVMDLVGYPEEYRLAHLHESPYPFDFGIEPETPYTVSRLAMFQFHVGPGDLGPATLTLYSDPEDGPVRMGWLAPDFVYGNLDDLADEIVTDADGLARIDLNLVATGEYCAVVYGNRAEHPGSLAVNVGLYGSRPDLTNFTQMGWYAPVVPQPHASSTLFNCPLPDTLHGGAAETWMNMGCRNVGTADADTVSYLVGIDGVGEMGLRQFTPLAPGATRVQLNVQRGATPWEIRGGRHTLSVTMDYLEDLAESVERNNESARQYCWSPLVLKPDLSIDFVGTGVLPDRTGGHDMCDGPETLYPNCDGLRLAYVPPAGGDGWWRAAAVMPLAAHVDIDLELHERLAGTQDGFGPAPLAASTWGDGAIDFVLVRDRFTSPGGLDLAVLDDVDTYTNGYHAQDARSRWRGSVKSLDGTYNMPAGRMIDLHEYQLGPGTWLFTLTDGGGGVDWGMSLYEGSDPHGKDDAVTDGLSWQAPAGGSERMLVTVPVRGYYCLAVWKTSVTELAKDGDYGLWTAFQVSGAPDDVPAAPEATRLVAAAPNPCNPRTTISFELAADGPCRLALYDVQGRLVRTLVSGHRPAGPGREDWDGKDDAGRRAASGVYLARLQAGGVEDLLKVTLVK